MKYVKILENVKIKMKLVVKYNLLKYAENDEKVSTQKIWNNCLFSAKALKNVWKHSKFPSDHNFRNILESYISQKKNSNKLRAPLIQKVFTLRLVTQILGPRTFRHKLLSCVLLRLAWWYATSPYIICRGFWKAVSLYKSLDWNRAVFDSKIFLGYWRVLV